MRMIRFEEAKHQIALSEKENAAFTRGVEAVTSIRCMDHRHVRSYNEKEAAGGECPACLVDVLVDALKKAHACATLENSVCRGCFVSAAIAVAEGAEL